MRNDGNGCLGLIQHSAFNIHYRSTQSVVGRLLRETGPALTRGTSDTTQRPPVFKSRGATLLGYESKRLNDVHSGFKTNRVNHEELRHEAQLELRRGTAFLMLENQLFEVRICEVSTKGKVVLRAFVSSWFNRFLNPYQDRFAGR